MKYSPILNDVPMTLGNSKLPRSTAVLNITPASLCVSKLLGYCQMKDGQCYARKFETRFAKNVVPVLLSQMAYWDSHTPDEIALDIAKYNLTKRAKLTALRIGVTGDFRHQADLYKAETLAGRLKSQWVRTYCYTARHDLDYSSAEHLIVNGSGWMAHNQFQIMYPGKNGAVLNKFGDPVTISYVCPGSCRKCSRCLTKHGKIVGVKLH